MTAPFARSLLGWKSQRENKLGWSLVPNFSDVDNAESMRIGAGMLDELAVPRDSVSDVPHILGPLEQAVRDHLDGALPVCILIVAGWWRAARSSPGSTSTPISAR